MGGDEGRAGQAVRGQGAAGVEAEPAEPEEAGPEDGHGQVVRNEGLPAVALPAANDQGGGQGGDTGVDVHHRAPGKVQGPQVLEPAAVSPDPVGHRVIDQRGPQEHEHQKGTELQALRPGPGDQRRGDDGKHGLKNHKRHVGNGFRIRP